MSGKPIRIKKRSWLHFPLSVSVASIIIPLALNWQNDSVWSGMNALAAQPQSFPIEEPLRLNLEPLLVLETGRVIIRDSVATGFRWTFGLEAATPRKLLLKNARFVLDTGAMIEKLDNVKGGEPVSIFTPLLQAIGKFGFDSLDIVDATLIISNPLSATKRKINRITAFVKRNSSGVLTAKGHFWYREQKVSFTSSLDLIKIATNIKAVNGLVPFTFHINSDLLQSSFTGQAAFSNGLQLQGDDVTVTSRDLCAAIAWLNGHFSRGSALKNFKVSGTANLVGNRLSFERAVFAVDGNEATGGLALTFGKARPIIEGTLASKFLRLDPYFHTQAVQHASATLSGISAPSASGSNAGDYDMRLPVLTVFDADIRLSANAVQYGSVRIGRTAAVLSIRNGKFQADIAEIELGDGRGIGLIAVDMSRRQPHYRISGKVEGIEVSTLAAQLIGDNRLEGRADLTLDLNGSGKTLQAILAAMSGKINLNLPEGGTVGIDPWAMSREAAKATFSGWTKVLSSTQLDEAQARFEISNGQLKSIDVTAKSGDQAISCRGSIDVLRKWLNLKIVTGKVIPLPTRKAAIGRMSTASKLSSVSVLQLYGAWTSPTIHLQSGPKKAIIQDAMSPSNSG